MATRSYKVLLFLIACITLSACGAGSVVDVNDVPPDVSGADHTTEQIGYRASFRIKIGDNSLTLDKEWVSRYDPYQTGQDEQAEPTPPVIAQGRVHYTTNTLPNATTPMKIFWQETDKNYVASDPPLAGEEMLLDSSAPGWNFFHLSIDNVSGIIMGMDQIMACSRL